VAEPAGEVRNEYAILAEIAARLGKDITTGGRPLVGKEHCDLSWSAPIRSMCRFDQDQSQRVVPQSSRSPATVDGSG
jgi:hypothetical protein